MDGRCSPASRSSITRGLTVRWLGTAAACSTAEWGAARRFAVSAARLQGFHYCGWGRPSGGYGAANGVARRVALRPAIFGSPVTAVTPSAGDAVSADLYTRRGQRLLPAVQGADPFGVLVQFGTYLRAGEPLPKCPAGVVSGDEFFLAVYD